MPSETMGSDGVRSLLPPIADAADDGPVGAVEAGVRARAGGDVAVIEDILGVYRELQALPFIVDGGVEQDVVIDLEGVGSISEA